MFDVIEALDNYTKEWDDRRGVWKNKPLHNEYSHMADAIRYMALSETSLLSRCKVGKLYSTSLNCGGTMSKFLKIFFGLCNLITGWEGPLGLFRLFH